MCGLWNEVNHIISTCVSFHKITPKPLTHFINVRTRPKECYIGHKWTEIWSENVPDLSHFLANLIHVGTKPDSPAPYSSSRKKDDQTKSSRTWTAYGHPLNILLINRITVCGRSAVLGLSIHNVRLIKSIEKHCHNIIVIFEIYIHVLVYALILIYLLNRFADSENRMHANYICKLLLLIPLCTLV